MDGECQICHSDKFRAKTIHTPVKSDHYRSLLYHSSTSKGKKLKEINYTIICSSCTETHLPGGQLYVNKFFPRRTRICQGLYSTSNAVSSNTHIIWTSQYFRGVLGHCSTHLSGCKYRQTFATLQKHMPQCVRTSADRK